MEAHRDYVRATTATMKNELLKENVVQNLVKLCSRSTANATLRFIGYDSDMDVHDSNLTTLIQNALSWHMKEYMHLFELSGVEEDQYFDLRLSIIAFKLGINVLEVGWQNQCLCLFYLLLEYVEDLQRRDMVLNLEFDIEVFEDHSLKPDIAFKALYLLAACFSTRKRSSEMLISWVKHGHVYLYN